MSENTLHHAIQVAGVIDRAEADMLVGAGVDFLGFPLRLRDGREDLSEDAAAAIVASLPASVHAVCITYLDRAEDIATLITALGFEWVQLHAPMAAGEIDNLRRTIPELKIIKSLIVRIGNTAALADEVDHYAPLVDAFITDTHDPATDRTGATGLTHDWAVSTALVAASPRPVILAGGLDPANVGAAIAAVGPAAVDAHSGLESRNGRKNRAKVVDFVRQARRAFVHLEALTY